jgi:hypothetical protein
MNENQIWKIKKIIGVKLKNICNVIAYSKIKKIVIKMIEIKCEGKRNYRDWYEIL